MDAFRDDQAYYGDLYVPRFGFRRAHHFRRRGMPLQVSLELRARLSSFFAFEHDGITATFSGNEGGYYCAIADADFANCPLVFVSKAFSEFTGYSEDFAEGRTWNFIQPKSKTINAAFNPECVEFSDVRKDRTWLELSEKASGERYWTMMALIFIF